MNIPPGESFWASAFSWRQLAGVEVLEAHEI